MKKLYYFSTYLNSKVNIYNPSSSKKIHELTIGNLDKFSAQKNTKLILHPLSDLDKEITVDGKIFIPFDVLDGKGSSIVGGRELREMLYEGDYSIYYLKFATMQILTEWHFNIFPDMPKEYWIDINTLKL